MLLLPATLMNKHDPPKQVEFHACASVSKPQTNWWESLLVVDLVKLRLTSFKSKIKLPQQQLELMKTQIAEHEQETVSQAAD